MDVAYIWKQEIWELITEKKQPEIGTCKVLKTWHRHVL